MMSAKRQSWLPKEPVRPKLVQKSAEAKSKATDGNISAAQAKASQQQAAQVKAKHTNATSVPQRNAGWLNVNIRDELPKDKPLLTPHQAKQLEELEVFFRQLKTKVINPRNDTVLVQCELQNNVGRVLQENEVGKVREFQRWLNSRKYS